MTALAHLSGGVMGRNIPLFTDTFDRPAQATAQNLTADARWELLAGAANLMTVRDAALFSGGTGAARFVRDPGSLSQWAEWYDRTNATTNSSFVCLRMASATTFIGVRTQATRLQIYKSINNTSSAVLASNANIVAVGDLIRFEVQDTTVRAYRNGVLIISTTISDADLQTSTRVGLAARTNVTAGPWLDVIRYGTL